MTHSRARRAWAASHRHLGLFGRETIAAALGVPARTITTWSRADAAFGPPLTKTAREFERAQAILLYRKYPNCIEQISSIHKSSPRMVQQWATQICNPSYLSELAWATRLMMVVLNPLIKQYFANENGKLILIKNRFPDSLRATDLIFQVYYSIFEQILNLAGSLQLKRNIRDFSIEIPSPKRITQLIYSSYSYHLPQLHRLNGPHRYRGAVIHKDGSIEIDSYVADKRRDYQGFMRNINSLVNQFDYSMADGNLRDTLRASAFDRTKKKLGIEFGGHRI